MNRWIKQSSRRLMVRLGTQPWPSRSALIFTLHTTAAALLALVVAQLLALPHPWWAAMTVWLVAQPTRNLLIGRIGARLIGTAVGALAGGLLLAVFFDHQRWLMLALAVWIAACAGVGNRFRHFRNYGFVLAGYTAAIVALFGVLDPVLDVDLALGRLYCTVIGVLASGFFSWAFTGKSASLDSVHSRLDALVVASVRHTLERLEPGVPPDTSALSALLGEIAALDVFLDEVAAGSRTLNAGARRVRDTLRAIVDLLVCSHGDMEGTVRLPSDLVIPTDAASAAAMVSAVSIEVRKYAHNLPAATVFIERLRWIFASLNGTYAPDTGRSPWAMQHSWRVAGLAASRPLIAMGIATAAWWALDWSEGPMMVMTAVLFASLFSSQSHANAALNDVLIGSMAGAILGVACRLWLLPGVETTGELVLVIAPFLMIGAWLMARPGTAKLAIDLNMTFLLIAQPGLHTDTAIKHSLLQTVAILGGVSIAVLTYRWLVPSSPGAQRARLCASIARLTLKMAKTPDVVTQANDYAQVSNFLIRLIGLEKRASALLIAAFECATVAQLLADHRTAAAHSRAVHLQMANLAVAELANMTNVDVNLP